eukprot:NODE_1839_length_1285_cov_57.241909_g1522_i0.p1 GENE.NODE_1839_length_1285_cov_57.241909_g1522_i0~~NODE_1839_length_1285_cov_57.241909_g1522_i0.p1  ORF type:complete len:369 (+),score=134.30 NODE_1839_length_1285_cov_57.241909_g1522_i0:61-1167(+)
MSKGDPKDLFAMIASSGQNVPDQQDINVLILGNKGVGKSTLVQRFIKREDTTEPLPTVALEYNHGKKEERNQVKMAHFWELGGGQQLASLLDVCITPENIHTVLVMIVVDLSDPKSVFSSLLFWIHRLKKRVSERFIKMKSRGSSTPGKMLSRMQKRFGEKHPDLEANKIQLIGIPMIIVGTHYDKFKDESAQTLTMMAKTMRYWAHTYAAVLIWLSVKDEKDMVKYRQLLNHLIFAVSLSGSLSEMDHSKPLLILPGKDSLKDIGPPANASRAQGFVTSGNEDLDKWKAAFEQTFPPKEKEKKKDDGLDLTNPEFAEPGIDAMRQVKDDELEQYRQRRQKALEDQARREAKARSGAEDKEKKDEKKK